MCHLLSVNYKSMIKAIGGGHVDLFERSPLGGTNALYRMSKLIFVQKLSHFKVRDFGRISYKKIGEISILGYCR